MKKIGMAVAGILGVIFLGAGAAAKYIEKKGAVSVSVIGSGDGPTSIFLAGSLGDVRIFGMGLIGAGLCCLLILLILALKNHKS